MGSNHWQKAGETEFIIRYSVMSLLTKLQSKAKQYTKGDKEGKANSHIKAHHFILNNAFYVNKQFGENTTTAPILRNNIDDIEGEDFKTRSPHGLNRVFRNYLNLHWKSTYKVLESEMPFIKNDNKVRRKEGRKEGRKEAIYLKILFMVSNICALTAVINLTCTCCSFFICFDFILLSISHFNTWEIPLVKSV